VFVLKNVFTDWQEDYMSRIIGEKFTVIIDRPIGSTHPDNDDVVYEVNYGYIEGIIAADGEEQDAYVLGVYEPVKEFFGKVIAIIHRYDDVEEKWVVAKEDKIYTKEEIKKQVEFQEKYFNIEIKM
jgi:inorganic pyrophosphatase